MRRDSKRKNREKKKTETETKRGQREGEEGFVSRHKRCTQHRTKTSDRTYYLIPRVTLSLDFWSPLLT